MNTRIKKARIHLGYNQSEFASKIGLGQAALSAMEKGIRGITDRNIQIICKEFNVNEEWLRTGEGSMFVELSREDELAKWAGSLARPGNKDEFTKKFVHMLSKLSVEDWEVLEKMAELMVEEMEDKEKEKD